MARVSDLRQDVRPSVPEAIVPEVDDAILRALISFCRQSRIWREELTVELTAETASYRLRPSQGGRVDQVLKAVYSDDKRKNMPITVAEYDSIALRASPPTAKVPSNYALNPSSRNILLYPTPNAPAADSPTVRLFVVVIPQRSSSSFPDFIREEWYEGLVHGALAMLYGMADKPWTNHALEQRERRDFNVWINRARREMSTRNWSRTRVIPRLTY